MRVSLFFLVICLLFCACSNNGAEQDTDGMEALDLTVIEGRYKGLWSWELGQGLISMVITPTSSRNIYLLEFYETNNYRPSRQSDGITPDARGSLELIGQRISIDLVVNVDNPPCPGTFKGEGTFSNEGYLESNMVIDDCQADEWPASWELEKKENL